MMSDFELVGESTPNRAGVLGTDFISAVYYNTERKMKIINLSLS